MNDFDPQFDAPAVRIHFPPAIDRPRFEVWFCPEWRQWTIIDHETHKLHRCENRASAKREAASLEMTRRIRRLVHSLADTFALN